MNVPHIEYDRLGTPGIRAESIASAYFGLGWLHGRHRGSQVLVLSAAGRGELAQRVFPASKLVGMDALAGRLDLLRLAEREVGRFADPHDAWVDAYLDGVRRGLSEQQQPWWVRALLGRVPPPDRKSLLVGFLLASYLGLAEGQERMSGTVLEAWRHGAAPEFLRAFFGPRLGSLDGPQPPATPTGLGFPTGGLAVGGSNAWAVGGETTASGYPMLAGDPHLQVNQLPSVFFEARIRVGDRYVMGATIPGIPGFAVGRNRDLAWSGTFSVVDNVDWKKMGEGTTQREARIRRRGLPARALTFFDDAEGFTSDAADGVGIAWAGAREPAAAIAGWMSLAWARDVDEARTHLQRVRPFALHMVLADRSGQIGYQLVGRTRGPFPRRLGAVDEVSSNVLEGEELPGFSQRAGMVVSANEPTTDRDGRGLMTLAQPDYRITRIRELLSAETAHAPATFQDIMADRVSLQARRLTPVFAELVNDKLDLEALQAWRCDYLREHPGLHVFRAAYRSAWFALAPDFGGDWFDHMLRTTEVMVWWADAFDAFIVKPEVWTSKRRAAFARQYEVERRTLTDHPYRVRLHHHLLGPTPSWWGLGRDARLLGSIATVAQANQFQMGSDTLAVGSAYRFCCDLGEDAMFTSFPGGTDEHPSSPHYDQRLPEWQSDNLSRIEPPKKG